MRSRIDVPTEQFVEVAETVRLVKVGVREPGDAEGHQVGDVSHAAERLKESAKSVSLSGRLYRMSGGLRTRP
jgi:hypothetical protein